MASNTNEQGKYEMVEQAKRATREELYKHAKQIFQNANRRLRNLEKNKLLSPAYSAAMKEGRFGARGKDYNQLTHEYARAINFLNMTTATVQGAKTYEKHIVSLVGNITPNKRKVLFEVFRKVEENNLIGSKMYGSDRLIQRISQEATHSKYDALNDLDRNTKEYQAALDELIERMGKLAEEKYEETMKVLQENSTLEFDITF